MGTARRWDEQIDIPITDFRSAGIQVLCKFDYFDPEDESSWDSGGSWTALENGSLMAQEGSQMYLEVQS